MSVTGLQIGKRSPGYILWGAGGSPGARTKRFVAMTNWCLGLVAVEAFSQSVLRLHFWEVSVLMQDKPAETHKKCKRYVFDAFPFEVYGTKKTQPVAG